MEVRAFKFHVDAEDRDLEPLELQVIGMGETLAECLGNALEHLGRSQPQLAARFTLDTPITAGDSVVERRPSTLLP